MTSTSGRGGQKFIEADNSAFSQPPPHHHHRSVVLKTFEEVAVEEAAAATSTASTATPNEGGPNKAVRRPSMSLSQVRTQKKNGMNAFTFAQGSLKRQVSLT